MNSTQPSMAKWQHLPIYARRALQTLEDNISDIEEIVAFNERQAALLTNQSKKSSMQLKLTVPLTIKTSSGKTMELLPVPMDNGFPSGTIAPWHNLWCKFLKAGGQRITCDGQQINRIQHFMREHGTEALSEDGEVAFTVAGTELVECDPSVCMNAQEETTI